MVIGTRDFGEREISEQEIITFVQPIYGFEGCVKFALLSDDQLGFQIRWLQSLDDESLCFIVVDPCAVEPVYTPVLDRSISGMLDLQAEQPAQFWAIAVIPEDFQKTTLNLKSPIVLNPTSMKGAQVILDDDYPIRAALFSAQKGNG